jgi:hypothetical protein
LISFDQAASCLWLIKAAFLLFLANFKLKLPWGILHLLIFLPAVSLLALFGPLPLVSHSYIFPGFSVISLDCVTISGKWCVSFLDRIIAKFLCCSLTGLFFFFSVTLWVEMVSHEIETT